MLSDRLRPHVDRFFTGAMVAALASALGCADSARPQDVIEQRHGALGVGPGTLTWTLPPYADPLRVPLTALNELKINDRARTFTPELTPGAVASLGGAVTNLGVDAVVGEMNSTADVFLRERATVSGNLTTAGTVQRQNGTQILGTLRERASMTPGTLGLSLTFEPSTRDVESSNLSNPPPGRYHRILVRNGNTTLTAGVYKVNDLIVDPGNRILVDARKGPVIVLVSEHLIMSGRATSLNSGYPEWVVAFGGTADVFVGSTLDGTFFAPNSKVNLSIGAARHEGTIVARNIELHQEGQYIHHPDPVGIGALRKLFGVDCSFAVPMIALGRNGHDPVSFLDEQTTRVIVQAGFNPLHELATKWENEVQATAMAWGDFDGDGQDELAVGRSPHDGGRLVIYDDVDHNLNEMRNDLLLTWGNGFGVTAVATGDIDSDGLDEIVVSRNGSEGIEISVIDDALHGFGIMREINVGNRTVHALAIGDADNDGKPEILAARDGRSDNGAGRISVIQDPSQGWGEGEFADWGDTDRSATAVAIGNLDGDEFAEIAVGRDAGAGGRVLIYRFVNGAYRPVADFNHPWGSERAVTALTFADVDGNSTPMRRDQELIVGRNGSGGDSGPRVFVYDAPITNLALTVIKEMAADLPGPRGVQSLAARDVDFDGRAEILVGLTTGGGARVVVYDDAVGEFRAIHAIGEEWGSDRNARSLAISNELVCESRPASRLPDSVEEADAKRTDRRADVIRSWVRILVGRLQNRLPADNTSSKFARTVFGNWTGENIDTHGAMRLMLAGAAALTENLQPEAQILKQTGFVDLMNLYIVENVTMSKNVGTQDDFDFEMMELLEILYLMEPLNRPGEPGVKMLTNEAIFKLSLSRQRSAFLSSVEIPSVLNAAGPNDFLIPYTGNVHHHLIDSWNGLRDEPETENHVLMINTWAFLMNQWVTDARRGVGPLFGAPGAYQNANSGLEMMLLSALGRFLKNGSWETNGRPYQAFTVRAIELLAKFAKGKVQDGAKNALDTLLTKFAFQSLYGRRSPPMRRNVDYRGKIGFYQNDYLAATFGVLTGATVFDTSPHCRGRLCIYGEPQQRGFALDAALIDYKVPATIHDLMLRPDNHQPGFGAWARMHDRFTERHYLDGKEPRYPVPNPLPDQPDLNQEIANLTQPIEPQAELYFVTRDYMNAAGGRTEHYGAFDFLPDSIFGQSLSGLKNGTDFWRKPTVLVGNLDFGYWTDPAGAAQETLVNGDLGTYKNFVYGSVTTIPDHWRADATGVLGDATFTVVDSNTTRSLFSAPDYFLVVGRLPGLAGDHGLWEVVPRRLAVNEHELLTNVLNVNAGNSMSRSAGYEYTLTVSGERMTLNAAFPTGDPFVAIDGSADRVRANHLEVPANRMPLMDVRQVDDRYRFTGVGYACASGDGRVVVNNPSRGTVLILDSRNHLQPTRAEVSSTGGVDPCTNLIIVPTGTGGAGGAGGTGGGAGSGGTSGAGGAGGRGGTGGAGGRGGTGGAGGRGGAGGTGGAGGMAAQVIVDNDWGGGYCADIRVTNNTSLPTVGYTVTMNTGASTITNLWNGTYSPASGTVTVAPLSYHAKINPGATDIEMGFCANRNAAGNGAMPTIVSVTGTF